MDGSQRIASHVMKRVEETVRRHGLSWPGDRIVVGVSGGPDSVALLHILWRLREAWRWELAVAHLHHGIRGRDADNDLAFVAEMAGDLDLPFYRRILPNGTLKRKGWSLQEAARHARYEFLEGVRVAWKGDRIALGHQGDDQAETVLAALIRGAGTRGLRGMPYRRDPVLVRPLLDVTRQEIIQFLEACSIPFRQDPSNQDLTYRRNLIRHALLPMLRERFNPRVDDALRQTGRICAAEDALLESQVDTIWQALCAIGEGRVEISAHELSRRPTALRLRLLRRAYAYLRGETRGLALRHLEQLDRLNARGGKERWLHLPGGVRAVVGAGMLVMGRADALEPGRLHYAVRWPGETLVPEAGLQIRWEILDGGPPSGWRDRPEAVFMDLNQIQGDPLLRGPVPGDRLRPVGLGGSRKVQDILVDRRVPRRERWRVPILVDALGIVWVVGHRLDERVGVGPTTERVLKATVRPLRPI